MAFILNFFKGVLGALGLYHKDANVVFLGLDNAGKTTLLHMLKDNRYSQVTPTQHPHSEEMVMGKIKFQTFDLGGHEIARRLWQDYYTLANAVIFLVDCAATERFPDAKHELETLLQTPELNGIPFVILGNKIDKRGAVSEEELREALGLPMHLTFGKDKKKKRIPGERPVEIFMCSVSKRMGYNEGFQWLSQFL
eukprot:TRINITY_DN33200_c0_g1_i1.p1 TRINITY_DN33200_c0_g1~~TRINITY_DN33200_c0_g1_i1.p1  ORF type:complete len:195 (+),score=22.68 TRINITY_DN33200_c0_g1_i1:1-585(+)